jgi:hypothetical protein
VWYVSGKKDTRAVTEWHVRLMTGAPDLVIPAARCRRDEHGGYTFTGARGIVADFPPGMVESVLREPRVREFGFLLYPKSLASLTAEQVADLEEAMRRLPELAGVTLHHPSLKAPADPGPVEAGKQ